MSVRQGVATRIFSTSLIIGAMVACCALIVWQRNAIRARWYARKLSQAQNPADVAYAAAALSAMGPAALKPAIQLLDNPRPDIRVLATLIVARSNDPSAGRALFETLSDNDLDVRLSAAVQLGLMPGSYAIVGDLAKLASEAPLESSLAAIVALEKQPSTASARVLRDLASSHPSPSVRAQAAESLGRRRDPDAIPVLIGRLDDSAPVDAELLGDYRDERVLGEVIRRGTALPLATSRSAQRRVADYAERSLQQLTGKRFKPADNDVSLDARKRFWQATRPLDPTSFPADLVIPDSP